MFDDNPENWEFSKYRAIHKPSGTPFWVASGFFFFQQDWLGIRVPIPLGLIKRWRLWCLLRKLRKEKFLKDLSPYGFDSARIGRLAKDLSE